MGPIFDDLIRVAPLTFTVIGWYFVNQQQNFRERRKEHRSLIDTAKRDIAHIATESEKYYCNTMATNSHEIKRAFHSLWTELNRLPGFTQQNLEKQEFFWEACTGGVFEEKNRPRLDAASPEIHQIYIAKNDLIQTIEDHFDSIYCKKSWLSYSLTN